MNTTQNTSNNPYHQQGPSQAPQGQQSPRGGMPQGMPPQGNQQQGGQNGNAPLIPPTPPKVGRPDGLAPNIKDAPEDIRWGVWAWLLTSLLQVLYAIVQFTSNVMDKRTLYSSVKQQIENGGGMGVAQIAKLTGQGTEESIQQVVNMTNYTMTIWMIFAALMCAWFTLRAGRGGNYSRMFLSVGSIYLALNAVLVVFSSAPDNMNVVVALLSGALTIVSGVTAVVGLYFFTRPGNAEWLGIPPAKEVEAYQKEALKYQEAKLAEKEQKKAQKEAQKKAHEQAKLTQQQAQQQAQNNQPQPPQYNPPTHNQPQPPQYKRNDQQ